MGNTRHFAAELYKIAFRVENVPRVTVSKQGVKPKTGSSVPMPATLAKTPAVKAPAPVKMDSTKSVPTATGTNLGTKVNPLPRTAPSAEHGGSLVR